MERTFRERLAFIGLRMGFSPTALARKGLRISYGDAFYLYMEAKEEQGFRRMAEKLFACKESE